MTKNNEDTKRSILVSLFPPSHLSKDTIYVSLSDKSTYLDGSNMQANIISEKVFRSYLSNKSKKDKTIVHSTQTNVGIKGFGGGEFTKLSEFLYGLSKLNNATVDYNTLFIEASRVRSRLVKIVNNELYPSEE